jgi:hypothetical protein
MTQEIIGVGLLVGISIIPVVTSFLAFGIKGGLWVCGFVLITTGIVLIAFHLIGAL